MNTVEGMIGKGKKKRMVINGQDYAIEFELIGKYRLKPGRELSDAELAELLEENERVYYDKLALRRLQTMRTEYELAKYLEEKGASKKLVRDLMAGYRKKKYVDDGAYAAYYVDINKGSEGPLRIKDRLKQKGIALSTIENALDYPEYPVLFERVKKKVESNRTKNRKKLVMSLKTHFVGKGFSLETVDEAIKAALRYDVADEEALLKKDYDRLIETYGKKMDRAKLEPFVKQKLYQKGYKYEDIKKLF